MLKYKANLTIHVFNINVWCRFNYLHDNHLCVMQF